MVNSTEPRLSFKQLTPDNWLKHDTTGSHIVTVSPNDVTSTPTDDGWATMILTPRLSENVPRELVELFEVARGALCYGFFFYPLYTLGSGQLYRVIEAAVAHRCKSVQAPVNARTFSDQINWLRSNGKINETKYNRLHAARNLRNRASHPDNQAIYDQTMAIRGVTVAVELIDQLFEVGGSDGEAGIKRDQ